MRAEIISIGSELVSGQSLDTNSQWLSRELSDLGISVALHTTLGDTLADHVAVFRAASERADLAVVTGGLGPTQDDLTREALAECAGAGLVEHPESLAAIAAMFARRNRVMTDRNRTQAFFPEGAKPLPNPVGTAPGIWMRIGRAAFGCLPGVPSEMKLMFREQVVPRLRQEGFVERIIVHRKINLFGKGEADIESQALDLTVRGREPEVGITAHDATISFRISAAAATEDEARSQIEPTAKLIYERFGNLVLGEGSVDVPEALFAELVRTGATLATAESCTGGLIAHMITALPDISPFYLGGVVSYANEAKTSMLDVPAHLFETHGAVSAEVAAEMAHGVRNRFGADVGLSTTGVAGPGGGTVEKPVGLVYLGLSTAEGTQTRRIDIGADQPRAIIQHRASKAGINWVRLTLIRER
jgi:competence/damage-inducible protein CinA-like protein